MTLFKNKYRIESTRLQGWDYSSPGGYFVTICTKGMVCWFGDVVEEKFVLSRIGEIVAEEWQKTEQIRNNVSLDEWVVMPNHLHSIVVIHESEPYVETRSNASLHYKNKFGPQRNNLSSIIRGFKSVTTKRIHVAGYTEFEWQSRFYDHIIRDEKSLHRVRRYINDNPAQWEFDRNHAVGLFNWS